MKLTFLGTGSAFTTDPNNFQSNLLLEHDGERLLLDCGGDARWSLSQLGLGAADIKAIYISHNHADHIGGLEWLAFSTYFNPKLGRPDLFASADVLRELWSHGLKAGLGSLEGELAGLGTYFVPQGIRANGHFTWAGIDFQVVQVVHFMNGFAIVPSYGLFWTSPETGKKIFWTSDTQFCPNQIKVFYKQADIIFQDCETSPFKSGVHAHYSDLLTLPDDVRAKMVLYHYQPGMLPDAVAAGFRQFAKKHDVFEL